MALLFPVDQEKNYIRVRDTILMVVACTNDLAIKLNHRFCSIQYIRLCSIIFLNYFMFRAIVIIAHCFAIRFDKHIYLRNLHQHFPKETYKYFQLLISCSMIHSLNHPQHAHCSPRMSIFVYSFRRRPATVAQ